MSEMNFIPRSLAQYQRNQRILNKGGKSIVYCAAFLASVYFAITAYNSYYEQEITSLTAVKTELNSLLQQRDAEATILEKTQVIAASLDQLNSFAALTAMLNMLKTIPDETALDSFNSSFNQKGESIILLEGVADSHKNLTNWVRQLRTMENVLSAELVSNDSIQSLSSDELRQKFVLEITRAAMEKTAS